MTTQVEQNMIAMKRTLVILEALDTVLEMIGDTYDGDNDEVDSLLISARLLVSKAQVTFSVQINMNDIPF